jgi:hypothetical protein
MELFVELSTIRHWLASSRKHVTDKAGGWAGIRAYLDAVSYIKVTIRTSPVRLPNSRQKRKTVKTDASANASDLKSGGDPFESQLDHWPSRQGLHGLPHPIQTNGGTVIQNML